MAFATFVLLAAVQLVSAHFQVEFPAWRSDSLTNPAYSQYVFPCAGVPAEVGANNRTDWPLTGGALELDVHHTWSYIFINLGFGENVTNFNYTLTPNFWNETGSGTLCIPRLPLPAGLTPTEGQHATLQVITLGASGQSLYNCADITFRSNATAFGGQTCTNGTNVTLSVINPQVNGSTSTNNSSGSSGKNAGSATGVNTVALTSVVALAVAFVYGMGL